MNILLSNSTDIFAGGEDYVFILARYLRARGHRVTVSANPGHLLLRKCAEADIPVAPLEYRGMSRVFGVAGDLRGILQRDRMEIIHSNANYDRTCAAFASVFSTVVHVAGVHSAHSIQHNITHWWRNRWGTAHFIADAGAVKEVLVRHDGIPADRISVIPIGVEEDAEEFQREARARARKALQLAPETIVVGNVARLVPFKGHRYLLQSIAGVLRHRHDVVFLLIGDGELQSELHSQAAALNITHAIRWLGFRDDLRELYPAFDIYCHSSLELAAEAFPIAILRALASRLPVVSTNVGGIKAMVEDGLTGFLTPPEDPDALTLALLKVIADSFLRISMGRESHALFLRKFHASAMAESVEQIYLAALNSRR